MPENHTLSAKKAHPKTVVILFVIVLAVIGMKTAAAAKASPADEYNDGVKTVICQLLDSGYSADEVIAELEISLASLEDAVIDAGGEPGDYEGFMKQAIVEKCPEYVGEV